MRRRLTFPHACLLVLGVALATAPTAGAETAPADRGQTSAIWTVGYLSGGELGRGINSTGGETLVGRLRDGPLVGFRVTKEGSHLTLGIDWSLPLLPVEVENDAGAEFPDHAAQLVLFSGVVEIHPLGARRDRLDLYLCAAVGGAFASVDLDNRGGQELSLLGQWTVGAGLRRSLGDGRRAFLDLRYEKTWIDRIGDGGGLEVEAVSLGYGRSL